MAHNIASFFIMFATNQLVFGEQSPLLALSDVIVSQPSDLAENVESTLNTNVWSEIQPTSTYMSTPIMYDVDQIMTTGNNLESSVMASPTDKHQWNTNDVNTRLMSSAAISNTIEQELSPSVMSFMTAEMPSIEGQTGFTDRVIVQPSLMATSLNSVQSDHSGSSLTYSSDSLLSNFEATASITEADLAVISSANPSTILSVFPSLPIEGSTITPSSMNTSDFYDGIVSTISMSNGSLSLPFVSSVSLLTSATVEPQSVASVSGKPIAMTDAMSSLDTEIIDSAMEVTTSMESMTLADSSTFITILNSSFVVMETNSISVVEVMPSESLLPQTAPGNLSTIDATYMATASSIFQTTPDMMTVSSVGISVSSMSYTATTDDDNGNMTVPYVSETITLAPSISPVNKQLTVGYNMKVNIVLSGNCSVLDRMNAADQLRNFHFQLTQALSSGLNLTLEQVRIMNTRCGSIIVKVLFVNVTSVRNVSDSLKNMTGRELFSTSADNKTFSFFLLTSELLPAQSAQTPQYIQPAVMNLTDVQIIIIIVCSVIGGTLLTYAFGFCIYACYQKKNSQSFDLSEMPVSDLNMDDFTLTKLQRPNLLYSDYGPIMQPARFSGKTKRRGDRYQPVDDEIPCLTSDNIHTANTLPCRSSAEVVPNRGMDNCKTCDEQHTPEVSAFVNPSYSGDDTLDSNPNAQCESSTNPESHQSADCKQFENISAVALNKNSNGHVVGESATSF